MNNSQSEAMKRAVEVLGSQAKLARALGVSPVTVGQWLKPDDPTGRQVPPKQCVRIEQLTGGAVARRELRSVDYLEIWPELAEAQAKPAPAATELIAVVKAAIDEVVHQADDRLAELKKDAQVEMMHTSLEVRGEIEKDAHEAMERLAAPKVWDGHDRRADAVAVAAAVPWDGQERRNSPDRRQPAVMESPVGDKAA